MELLLLNQYLGVSAVRQHEYAARLLKATCVHCALPSCRGNNPMCQYTLKSYSYGVVAWQDIWSKQICQCRK
jgi:hypothetical protein